jgi:hypothetical protein
MANDNVSVTLLTQPFTLSFPEVLTAKAYQEKGKPPKGDPEFSFEGISDLDNLTGWQILDRDKSDWYVGDVQKRLVKLAKERWGDDLNVAEAVKSGAIGWPFKSGDAKAAAKPGKADHYQGRKSWRAHAKTVIAGRANEPALYEANADGTLKTPRLMRSTEEGKARINELFYGGAICTAELNAVAMQTPQGKYVTLYFNSLVFETDGERLGGGSHMERQRGVRGGVTQYDPSEGMGEAGELDDEIPF